MPTTAPTVHLNGTSRDELTAGFTAAYVALNAARDVLAKTLPNGRDYYVQPAGNFAKAMTEHHDRLRAIDALRQDMEDLGYATLGEG